MKVNKTTGTLIKRVSFFSYTVNALIDTGASNIFLSTKYYDVLKDKMVMEGLVQVSEHQSKRVNERYKITEDVFLDGNNIKGMTVVFYPAKDLRGYYVTMILGTEYLLKYQKTITLCN